MSAAEQEHLLAVGSYVTVAAVADQLGVSRNYIYDRLGEFGALVEPSSERGRDGRAPKRIIRIPLEGVEAWVRRHTVSVGQDTGAVLPTRRTTAADASRIIRAAQRGA